MRTLITSAILILLVFSSAGQAMEVAYLNGKFVNADGSFYTGVYSEYADGIKVSQLTVSNGLLHGSATYYFAVGTAKIEGSYQAGLRDGKWVEYNSFGQLATISYYSKGQKDGMWEVWDENGNKRFEMYYKNGLKTGVWKMWNDQGELTTKDFGQ